MIFDEPHALADRGCLFEAGFSKFEQPKHAVVFRFELLTPQLPEPERPPEVVGD